jgi:pyruvate dehydrogenase E2 component (dihydrolipoamide acetyltransferase)
MYEFRLPDVGEGIHEAELQEWLVEIGTVVDEGTPVAVINTDKVSVELPSPAAGVVSSLPWDAGDVLTVGQVLMVLDVAGPTAPDALGDQRRAAEVVEPDQGVVSAPTASPSGLGRPVAAPSTRKLALELGVSIDGLNGSGPAGRVLRSDVRAAADGLVQGSDEVPGDEPRRERLTGVRGAMFRHMSESGSAPATTTSTFTVRMERVEELVAEAQSDAAASSWTNIGIFSISAACLVRALLANPRINATADQKNGDLLVHRQVHLGIAVASPSGLVVPVLRNADSMSLTAISDGISHIATTAREGTLTAAQLRGGTFTVSSTGGLERARVTSTQPIINLPQVAILWMSRIRDEPVVENGAVRAGRQMTCSVSFDHRYLDGAEATSFVNDVTAFIEHPVRVLL